MKQFNTLLFLGICLILATTLQAQTRYLDEVFDDVEKVTDVTYGTNISILTGAPAPLDLKMDVYTPAGDDETERPTVIYLHTGSFLPQYFNGQITGGKQDSTLVEICTRLARMGYTAVAATYRQGWLPLAEDQNVRTSTLLQAAYRGIQDTRTCVRYLRKSHAEEGNPYGIDPNRIVLWGQGTGGYLSLGAAFLDRYEEVVIDKFIDTQTALPFVTEPVHGDVYGEAEAVLNLPNHVGYDNSIQMAVNMGGALGDSSWIEGSSDTWTEPATIGFHVVTDPFAPFGNGPVIVPTTQEFVVNVSGTRTATGRVNDVGTNDVLDPVLQLGDPLTAFVTAVKNVPIDLSGLGQAPTTLGTDHIYPFRTPGNRLESGPWDWWDFPTVQAIVAFINSQVPTANLDAQELHDDGLLTNPDMSAEKARAYIDTIMMYYAPRACFALNLQECLEVISTKEVISAADVKFEMAPNPASDVVYLRSDIESPMIDVLLFDQAGRLIRSNTNVNNSMFELNRGNLPPGLYIARINFGKGMLSQKVIFR